jgi:hypothetical protein
MINSLAKTGYWFGPTLTPNGTAVVIVCVTSAAIRPTVLFVGMELSRKQAGMARYLPRRVRQVLRSRWDDASY